jgi:MarR family transcriptional regulator, organic hydroperoxide resistance regulator
MSGYVDAATEAWERMREITHDPEVLGRLHSLAEEAGIIPGAAKALRFLSTTEPMPMRSLAAYLRCDNSYVTTIVDSLEEAGVAHREAHGSDRRIKVIVLTETGRALASRAQEILGTPPPAFRLLSEDEVRLLRDLMRKLGEGPQLVTG